MTRAVVHWEGSRPPTPAELRAIGKAWRAGLIPSGARVGCARANPSASLAAERGRLALLRHNLQQARKQSRTEIAQLRRRRDLSRPKLAANVRRFRAKWRDWVNSQIAAMRARHRAIWSGRIDAASLKVERARLELAAERGYQRDLRRMRASERRARAALPRARARGAVARQESDEQVRNNIAPELRPIWDAVKNQIRTRVAHKSRTEAFLEWAAENDAEIAAMQSDAYDPDDLESELAAQEFAHYAEAV